jgi:AraC-like DNA-binding protein
MATTIERTAGTGLERSCEPRERANAGAPPRKDWFRSSAPAPGIELLEAWFAGAAYGRHRHDSYTICVTTGGVQAFNYRGARHASPAGHVTVLHPDEMHDGFAGTEDGFGYRSVYLDPARVAEALRTLTGFRGRGAQPRGLPFAPAVSTNPLLARAIAAAFTADLAREPLARDALVLRQTEGLIAAEAEHSVGGGAPATAAPPSPRTLDLLALARARAFLETEKFRVVRSAELEAVTGLSRYELARQFRAHHGTSPYRYLLMRRLEAARKALRAGTTPLAELALDAGFADQAHFTRAFTKAYGLTPSRYRALGGAH